MWVAREAHSSVSITVDSDRIVAVGLLTQSNLDTLGPAFTHAWPVDDAPHFHELLRAIDEADRELRGDRDLSSVH
jgi:hypothetical protein